MRPIFLLFACAVAPLASSSGAFTQAADQALPPDVRWNEEPFIGEYRSRAGMQELEGRLGRITVPERRSPSRAGEIEIAFVHYRTDNPKHLPPLIYLVGGPGGSGIENGAFFAKHPLLAVLDYCDVIAVDQRGTGLSVPNLAEGPDLSYELPLDQPLTMEAEDEAFAAAVMRGVAYWTERGVDLGAYNTAESAEDIEAVRAALGLEKITLWGGSYGSHLGLAYLRHHSDRVERAVLTKVEGPDHTFKLPSSVQRSLEKVAALAAEDPAVAEEMPDLLAAVKAQIERLEKEPVTVEVEDEAGAAATIVMGAFDFKRELANALGGIRDIAEIPARLHALEEGDFQELGAAALRSRRSDVWSMMTVMMDCASGASPERWKRIAREAADPANLTGDTINAPFGPLTRRAAGDVALPASFRAPIRSDCKVLFVTGSLDARTPPSNVEEIRAGFPNHVHLAVTGVTHDSFEMLSPDYQRVLKAFLGGEDVASQTIEINEMRFRPL